MILGIYFFLIVMLKMVTSNGTKPFSYNIVEENMNTESNFHHNDFQLKLILSELPIGLIHDKDKTMNKEELSPQEYSIENKQADDNFVSNENIEAVKRPEKYEVKELASGKIQVGNCYINNYSKMDLDLNELSKVSDFVFNEDTNILIFHTHTSEAYEEVGIDNNFRTTDDAYNVVAVGETLKENLLLKKFHVLHDITKHDTPSYNGAYNASLETVRNILTQKKYQFIIDLHRDALSGNLHFRPTTQINGETASKLMFVVGTNASGLDHDGWMNNLKLALLIQNTGEEMYPGLFRDLNLAKYRYNQHLSEGALILEVGSTGNTLSDTKTAMKYFANILAALKTK